MDSIDPQKILMQDSSQKVKKMDKKNTQKVFFELKFHDTQKFCVVKSKFGFNIFRFFQISYSQNHITFAEFKAKSPFLPFFSRMLNYKRVGWFQE